MSALVDRAKLRWHLDLASRPDTHAWVLSLYRAGERHPETVDDYFPIEHASELWPELARAMKKHAGDERRHAALYGRAIDKLGEPVIEFEGPDVFNHAIRAETRVSWALRPGDDVERKRVGLANFFAHAHHLERRVARSLEYHREACERLCAREVGDVVARVHDDELDHVAYTGEALAELTTHTERVSIASVHRAAEARADRVFSARQVRAFLARFGSHVPRPRRTLYVGAAFWMEHAHG